MAEIALLILLFLSLPVLAIVAIVMAVGTRDRVRQLQDRVAALETNARDSRPAPSPEPAPIASPPVADETILQGMAAAMAPPTAAPASSPESPPPDPPQPAAPAPAPPSTTLEERFGTQWVVWVGGVALALGGIFLERYSIEQGWLGPAVRIFFAALFSALLILAGEWTRRNEIAAGIAALPGRHIPSILTAAGTVAAYATVYAAYALYGFLPPAAAFVLLGLVALATLAAALLHGPALAGLGLVGAFLAPALVSTAEPSYWALYIYLAVVTGATFALARARLWQWLAITAVVLGVLWTLPGVEFPVVEALGAHLFFTIAGFALAAAIIVSGLLYGPPADAGKVEPLSSGALAAYVLTTAWLVVGSQHDAAALTVFSLLAAATVAIAWRTDAALWAVPLAAALVVLVLLEWARPDYLDPLIMPAGVTRDVIPGPSTGVSSHIALGALLAALFGVAGFAVLGRTTNALVATIWSATAVITPIAVLLVLYIRIAEFDRSIPFAVIALLLAALNGYAVELLGKRETRPGLPAATAFFAAGAVAALALALTFALDKGWLTVSLALMVPGIAWVSEQRPLPILRQIAGVLIALVLARIGYEPRIIGNDLGTTPIFNWLLYGYGVPAAAFWTAGYLLRRRADDAPARMADAAAILFTVLLAVLEIRHFMTGGDMFRPTSALAEIAMQVTVGLAMVIGLEHLRLRTRSIVHNAGALVLGAATLAAIVVGLVLAVNPMATNRPVGGAFFNLVLLGYGIPAILAAILALTTRTTRPLLYRFIATATAVGLAMFYLGLEVRTLYHGERLAQGVTSDAEQYTYSAVWLAFGVLLLVAGLLLRSQPARLVSAAVVAFTVGKVFVIDMSGLTGIFRALSFIGLGVVLVGIGLLYQRLLFPARGQAQDPKNEIAGT